MQIRLDGKTALITGAASGIGWAIAQKMHEAGASVVIADIDGERARSAADQLGDNAAAMQVDVADVAACRQLVAPPSSIPASSIFWSTTPASVRCAR
jgi:NAD(P)-dependent dehydrogenase (short-subunit alcohol dehydrogenase family)